jgi:hypothetical protein
MGTHGIFAACFEKQSLPARLRGIFAPSQIIDLLPL